jgi:hypothetical protein
MLKFKNNHIWGLDQQIYNKLKDKLLSQTYYLYTWDFCTEKKNIDDNFYEPECNETNTWNFSLKYEDTLKNSIATTSQKYSFGNYTYNGTEECRIIAKANSHKDSNATNQCREISKQDIAAYNPPEFTIQKLLTCKHKRELNIFVFRNLKTRKLECLGMYYYCKYTKGVNRKDDRINSYSVLIEDLEKEMSPQTLNNFIKYMSDINIDYGRIELIEDDILGWCIIDINNSPCDYIFHTFDKNQKQIDGKNVIIQEFSKVLV